MIQVRTPCRLHFGLLAYGDEAVRQFGGVGLMVQKPDIAVQIEPASDTTGFIASGPMADRAQVFAQTFADRIGQSGWAGTDEPLNGARIHVLRAPRAHCGLGTGTQLAMAVGQAIVSLIEAEPPDAARMAELVGRGERSAIGAHGFFTGGMIVEGGKFDLKRLSPMVNRQPFPEDWRIVLVNPHRLAGLAGDRERQAFAQLPSVDRQVSAEMCRLVLLGLVPAVVEQDLKSFGAALFELQQRVGECFSAAQGGIYADPLLEEMVQHIRQSGIEGVGQSSWGPTIYAVTNDEDRAERIAGDLQRQFSLKPGEVMVTRADNHGSSLRRSSPSETAHRS